MHEGLSGETGPVSHLTRSKTDKPVVPDFSTEPESADEESLLLSSRWPIVPGYTILGELGRGGMGVVYKARQHDLRRLVALKMIRAGVDAESAQLARFRIEAEAVARLQHPHIVQIYQIGETASEPQGQHDACPFMALEYVEGGNLARKLAGSAWPAALAADLIKTLAGTMEFAHQRGILHRDLKPSNILLTNAGLPKIGDFGLAKLVEEGHGHQTQTGEVLGTPAYMAPEQALGHSKAIGVATDVYALGTILYQLLTGQPPFRGSTPLETLDQVRSQDPLPPGRFQRNLPRDLETICLKCLAKEPRQRYASAGALADDLGRFLAGEPIRARPISLPERLAKWARRRPAVAALVAVSAAAIQILVIVIFFANIRLQRERDVADEKRREAETNFQEAQVQRELALVYLRQARDAVDRMLTRVSQERLAGLPRMEPVRRELLEDALQFYQGFARQTNKDPEIRFETGRAYRRLGNLYASLGHLDKAEACYDNALVIQNELAAQFPAEPSYRQELAGTHYDRGRLLRDMGKPAEADTAMDQAQVLLESVTADHPGQAAALIDLVAVYNSQGGLLEAKGLLDQEEQVYRKCLDVLDRLIAIFPETLDYQVKRTTVRDNLGGLLDEMDRLGEAESLLRANHQFWEDLMERQPNTQAYESKFALNLYHLGHVLANTNRGEEAERLFRRAVDIRTHIIEKNPDQPQVLASLGESLGDVADLAAERKDWAEVRKLLEQAIGYERKALKLSPQHAGYRSGLISHKAKLTNALIELKDHDQAAKMAEELPRLQADGWKEYRTAAGFLARCVPLAEQDSRLSVAKRQAVGQAYAERAVALLREAIGKGYWDVENLRTDSSLVILRPREDFQRLLKDLAATPDNAKTPLTSK